MANALSVLASCLMVAAAAASPSVQETDFSGYWAHDAAASRVETADALAGLAGGGAPANLFVSQARNGSLVLSSQRNPSQPRGYRIGGESTVPAPGDEGGEMTVVTAWDGTSLVSEGSVDTEAGTLRIRERMSLQDDGGTLILEATVINAAGEATNHLVYRRWPDPGQR